MLTKNSLISCFWEFSGIFVTTILCKEAGLIHYRQGGKQFPLEHENHTLDQIYITGF